MTNWERRNDGSLKKSYVYKKNGKYISWIFDFDGTITGRSMDKAGNITKIFTVEITGQDLDIVLAQNDLHLAKRLIQLGIKPTKNVYF